MPDADVAVPTAFPPPLPASTPDIHYQPVTPWSAWGGIGGTVLIMAAVMAFLLLGGVAIMFASPTSLEPGNAAFKLHFDQPAVAYSFGVAMLASQLLGIGLTILLGRMFGGRIAQVLALRAPFPGIPAYLWAVPAFVVFGFGVGALVQWLSPQSSQADTAIMLELTRSPAWWLIFIAAVVLAPLQEELLFRGFLFSALARSRAGLIGATLLTSLGWAAIHGYSPQGDATIFALGLALSFILWRTGSTRVTMLCHGCYNALAFAAATFAPPPGV